MSKPHGTKDNPMNYALAYAVALSGAKLSPATQAKLDAWRAKKKEKAA